MSEDKNYTLQQQARQGVNAPIDVDKLAFNGMNLPDKLEARAVTTGTLIAPLLRTVGMLTVEGPITAGLAIPDQLRPAHIVAGEPTNPGVLIQPAITGYRQLSAAQAALLNEVKAKAEEVGQLIAKLRAFTGTGESGTTIEQLDQRWISIGVTDLQRGFMAVNRGIAQPTSFA
jgi:hypothetical protein